MKIVLLPWIYDLPTKTERLEIGIPVGLVSIATTARLAGHEVEIFEPNTIKATCSHLPIDEICNALASRNAQIYGFSTVVGLYHNTLKIAAHLKDILSKSLIIFGGHHATFTDVETLKNFSFVDIIIRGEAEKSFLNFLSVAPNKKLWQNIKGLTFRCNGQIIRTDDEDLVDDLDSLPIPDFKIYPSNRYVRSFLQIEPGRGCCFNCKFCSTSAFWKKRYRMKTPDRVIREIQLALDIYKTRYVHFRHDYFLYDENYILSLCDSLISKNLQIKWLCSARIDRLNTKILKQLQIAGCCWIEFGIETPSENIQKTIGKVINIQRAIDVLKACKDTGIIPIIFLMCGFPNENLNDFKKLLNFIWEIVKNMKGPGYFQLRFLQPLPKTEIVEENRFALKFDMARVGDRAKVYPKHFIDIAQRSPDIFPEFYWIKNKKGLQLEQYLDFLKFVNEILEVSCRHYFYTINIITSRLNDNLISLELMWKQFIKRTKWKTCNNMTYTFWKWCVKQLYNKLPKYILDLLKYEKSCHELWSQFYHTPLNKKRKNSLNNHVRLCEFQWDISAIIRDLCQEREMSTTSKKKNLVAIIAQTASDIKSFQLSELAYNVALLCNGHNTFDDIVSHISQLNKSGLNPTESAVKDILAKLKALRIIT